MRPFYTVNVAVFGEEQAEKKKQGRPYRLSTFHQFLAWLLTFKRFRNDMEHVADLFGIGLSTMERYYETWTLGIALFSRYQQPIPTLAQLVDMTPARIASALDLGRDHGVIFGDRTETRTDDPGTAHNDEHSALWSEYKGNTTIKFLTACTGSSYLLFVSRPLCGGCSDQAAHAVTGLPMLLPKPHE
jgi:hypothetical protein